MGFFEEKHPDKEAAQDSDGAEQVREQVREPFPDGAWREDTRVELAGTRERSSDNGTDNRSDILVRTERPLTCKMTEKIRRGVKGAYPKFHTIGMTV